MGTPTEEKRSRRGSERRRAPRLNVDTDAQLLICPASSRTTPMDIKLKDVSATGIGVLHSSPLAVGQKCVVKTDALPQRQSRLYTVVRAYPEGEGTYHIGMHSSQLMDTPLLPVEGRKRHTTAITIVLLLILAILGGAWYFLM